jgi:hypothetical protein
MSEYSFNHTGCLLVGEYVDEADIPAEMVHRSGEIVRPKLAASYVDVGGRTQTVGDDLSRELLHIIETETHGPSRANMVQSLVLLQALEFFRSVLHETEGQHKDSMQFQAFLRLESFFGFRNRDVNGLVDEIRRLKAELNGE